MDFSELMREGVSDVATAIGIVVAAVIVCVFAVAWYIIVSISLMKIMECLGKPSSYAWIPFYRQYLAGDYAARVLEPMFGPVNPYIKWCWCFAGLVSGVPIIGKFVGFVVNIFNLVVKIVSVYKTRNESVGLAILTFFFSGLWGFIVDKKDVQ